MPVRKSPAPAAPAAKAGRAAKAPAPKSPAPADARVAPELPGIPATRQARAERDGAAAAARPHLALMAQTAARGTDAGAAGLGLLLLWLADDVEQRANAALAPFGISESKLDVLMIFGLAERGLIDSRAVTPSASCEKPVSSRPNSTRPPSSASRSRIAASVRNCGSMIGSA